MNKNATLLLIIILIVMFIFLHYYTVIKKSLVTEGYVRYTKEQQAALHAKSAEYKKNPKKACTIL